MNYFFDKNPVSTIDDLLSLYKQSEFESPTRSTVPLFSLLKHDRKILGNIMNTIVPDAGNFDLHVEYTVKSPQGWRSEPSHTDGMLIVGDSAVAIEAKWTEPPYETVASWKNKGNTPNRLSVLNGWLSLLQPYAECQLLEQAFSNVVYQMVHRAASACATGLKPSLVYLQFICAPYSTTASVQQLRKDLTMLYDVLGRPAGFTFYLIEVQACPTPAWEGIQHLSKGQASTAVAVQLALHGGPLFTFPSLTVHSFA